MYPDCQYTGAKAWQWEAFFAGMSRSRSIKSITFFGCVLGSHILKLFDMPNLERVAFEHYFPPSGQIDNTEEEVFKRCIITSQTASAIRSASCLRHVGLRAVKYCDATYVADFITSLNHNHKLECLHLHGFSTQEGEIMALRDMISDPQSIIRVIELYSWGDDIIQLRNGLVNSSSLRELVVDANWNVLMTEGGSQVVSDVLASPVAALKVLRVGVATIDDESANVLGLGLARNTSMEVLNLSGLRSITSAGWKTIISSIQSPNLHLRQICLCNNEQIDDEVVFRLTQVLMSKSVTIEEFDIRGCRSISGAGWTALSVAFLTPMPNLSELFMGNEHFDDDVLVTFVNGLRNKPCLRKLDLARANIMAAGWKAISKILCDTSSLDTIRESNHTLHIIKLSQLVSLPPNISKVLDMNRSGVASEVSRLKVIQFYDGINIESLVDDQPTIQMKLVPFVISWLGKGRNKQNALFHFFQNQSSLLER